MAKACKQCKVLATKVADLERCLEHAVQAREDILAHAHNAPMAVGIDTRSLETAVRRLVDFAWEAVS